MAWKNQGGGPWGSGGPRGPWGSGSPSGGPTPNLEDLIRRGQDRLQSFLPGGNFGATGVVLVVAAAIVIWALWGFFTVRPDELGVVLRFGKHVRTVQPGLSYHLPYPIETVLLPKALRGQHAEHRHASLGRGPQRLDPRRAGREFDADRRREHRRRRFHRAVADQARRRRGLSLQYPEIPKAR